MKKPPTDEELKETVKKLLASANLEEVTMKQICKEVMDRYRDYFPFIWKVCCCSGDGGNIQTAQNGTW